MGKPFYATLISAGAVAGLTTVVDARARALSSISRVVFAMSRDWLPPPSLERPAGQDAVDHDRRALRLTLIGKPCRWNIGSAVIDGWRAGSTSPGLRAPFQGALLAGVAVVAASQATR